MGFSVDLLNSIRAEASDEYQTRVPLATQTNFTEVGNAIQSYTILRNEYTEALFNKIGKTKLEQMLFENKLKKYKTGTVTSQQDVEEIFIEIAKAEGAYDPTGPNPLGRRDLPDVKSIYHRMNRRDYYVLTLGDLDFVRVFRSEATHDSFVSSLLNSVYSGAEYDEWLHMKNLIASYDGYFNYQVPVIGADGTGAKAFVKTVRKAVNDLSFPSKAFNKGGVLTKSNPEDMVLFINKDVISEVDVEVLAKAFNMGKTDFETNIEIMDNFGNLENTYGLLVDKSWFRIYDTLSYMEPQRNAQGLFTNYFYHVHQILSLSTFKNAVRFTTAAVTAEVTP